MITNISSAFEQASSFMCSCRIYKMFLIVLYSSLSGVGKGGIPTPSATPPYFRHFRVQKLALLEQDSLDKAELGNIGPPISAIYFSIPIV